MITSRSGIALAVVASRLVQASSIASSPSIGGIDGSEPVARITARVASSSSSPTRSRRSPVSSANPRSSVIPRSSSHGSCTESSRSWMISSRRSSTAWTSSRPVIASAAPRDAARLLERLIGTQQRLRRHARPERALAADQPVLGDRHAQAALRQPARRDLARRPGADHHHVVGPHARSRRPNHEARRPLQWGANIDQPLGTTRLRRGRFAGAVASRGSGGLVKPRNNHKCG